MKLRLRLSLLSCLLLLAAPATAQPEWTFQPDQTIRFAEEDSMAAPYLGATDGHSLWVISSAEDSLYRNTYRNALYRAEPEQTTFTRIDDYTSASVRAPNGIAVTSEGDVFVSSRVYVPGDEYHPESMIMRYPGGDPQARETFTSASTMQDYGAWLTGISITRDGYVFAGRSWLVSIVSFDYSDGAEPEGEYRGTAGDGETPQDPGGNFDPWGSDLIRDVALVPQYDYSDPRAPLYTSRNNSMYEPERGSGGVTMWRGGTQDDPSGYVPVAVQDFAGDLDLGSVHPYGLTVDDDGLLYVAGTDPFRRWVKVFEVDPETGFAIEVGRLPSSSAYFEGDRDPNGAPFDEPSDVVTTSWYPADQTQRVDRAYVLDRGARAVFVFTRTVAVSADPESLPQGYVLRQNYPNPFNPVTTISVTASGSAEARLVVLDVLGREVAVLHHGTLHAGSHDFRFDASALSSGVYLYRLEMPEGIFTRTMHLIR